MNDQNFKNLCLNFLFLENLKNVRKNIMKSAIFLKLFFTKRRCSQKKPQLKVDVEDGREEP